MQRPHRLHLVLLAQLAALGCSAPPPAPAPTAPSSTPATSAPPTTTLLPSPSSSASTNPSAAASTTPPLPSTTTTTTTTPLPSTPLPPPSATAPSTPRAKAPSKEGDTCSRTQPCPEPLHCQLGFTGAEFLPTGTCTKNQPVYEGRPLLVDGTPRTAAVRATDHPATSPSAPSSVADPVLAASLLAAASEEHASIAAFARTLLALMHVGAPLSLLQATQAALSDEIRHAEDVLAAAVAAGAPPGIFATLPEATTPFAADPAAALLHDVLVGGCIGETLAAFRAEDRADAWARQPSHAALVDLGRRIAEDEARHAALAFATARFLLGRRPELRGVVDSTFARFGKDASADDVARVAPAWRVAFGAPSPGSAVVA